MTENRLWRKKKILNVATFWNCLFTVNKNAKRILLNSYFISFRDHKGQSLKSMVSTNKHLMNIQEKLRGESWLSLIRWIFPFPSFLKCVFPMKTRPVMFWIDSKWQHWGIQTAVNKRKHKMVIIHTFMSYYANSWKKYNKLYSQIKIQEHYQLSLLGNNFHFESGLIFYLTKLQNLTSFLKKVVLHHYLKKTLKSFCDTSLWFCTTLHLILKSYCKKNPNLFQMKNEVESTEKFNQFKKSF